MFLKTIEVHGFKSFANKIVFQFHNGITGIVGPNGSGKSNVADAVRWVLGEQRAKQLRGSNMQDVIFAGTELRKPMSYASVAITIDNSDHQLPIDYTEVTVTRRLYRSGESEYLMNGSQCRLRDIHELFYDTGIGKEGYSIIGQGQIDKILSGKPEERRELFDEAAGIVKFKRRKETAQKKLESEHQDLTRANDILSEIEKRLPPLQKQAETARIYLKKRDELKTYDVNSFLLELARIKKETGEVNERLSIAGAQTAEAQEAYAHARQEYEEIEAKVAATDSALEEKRSAHAGLYVQKEQLEGRLHLLEEQIRTAKASGEAAGNRLQQLKEQTAQRREEIVCQEQEKAVQTEILTALQKKYLEGQESLHALTDEIEAGSAQIEADRAAIVELLNGNAALKAGQQKFDTMMEQVSVQSGQIEQRIVALQTSESTYQESVSQFENELERIEQQIAESTGREAEIRRELSEVQTKLTEKNEALSKSQQQYLSQRSRLESLTNLTERYEGYGNSIRRVMEKKETTKGIVGVVADIIKTEKKYETAIETALGGSIQNIVTEDEQTAKQMITYLKENKLGRATFLPLTNIRRQGSQIQKDVLHKPGVIGIASALVTTDEKYSAVREYLLGRFCVVDTMDHALALAKAYKQSLRIVTLEGELLNPGGSITGGAFKNKSNLLGRRRELDQLQKSVAALQKETTRLSQEIEAVRAKRSELRAAQEKEKESLQKQYLRQNTAKMRLGQARSAYSSVKDEFEKLRKEKESAHLQISAIKAQQQKIASDMELSAKRQHELEEAVAEGQKALEAKRQKQEQYTQQSVDDQVELSATAEKLTFIGQTLTRLEEELAQLTQEEEAIRAGAADTEEDVLRKEDNLQAVTEGIAKAAEAIETAAGEIETLQKQREGLVESNRAFFAKREELSEKLSLLDKETYRLTSQQERLAEARENQINYMWEEYELTYSSAEKLKDEDLNDLRELRKMSKALRAEIRELGSVNVNAIEEYKETSERYTFLKTQRDDLQDAENTLLGIIEELDVGMRKQFAEKFAQIRQEFDKAFKELFGGGKGTLELVDEEDVLNTGINIISQPPGKKLQNMMQLSGGEKALTAIALLFAIQNLKPSPFCLLDEIEAALDDSNVGRFAGYLHKLTKHTQFIMITHRRGTMAAADRLYGITMQEKGVSTLVSVNLIEEQLE